jgi:hypothetical protein
MMFFLISEICEPMKKKCIGGLKWNLHSVIYEVNTLVAIFLSIGANIIMAIAIFPSEQVDESGDVWFG